MEIKDKNVPRTETQILDSIISKLPLPYPPRRNGPCQFSICWNCQSKTAVTDNDILNFALNLEYLEAEYYTIATSGMTIDQMGIGIDGTGTQGGVTIKGGSAASDQVTFTTPAFQSYAEETAGEERKHVTFLRKALGSAAVAQPAIDLLNSFNGLAVAAGIGPSFDPFANQDFLLGSYVFEDVGVTAYHGAAGLITSPTFLDAAAGILAVEAYHAGLIRTVLYELDAANPSAGINAIATKISTARAALDGTKNDDVGLGVVTNSLGLASTVVNADSNTIAFSRTTAQVLSIVYARGTGSGGFFPAGLNGTIK